MSKSAAGCGCISYGFRRAGNVVSRVLHTNDAATYPRHLRCAHSPLPSLPLLPPLIDPNYTPEILRVH